MLKWLATKFEQKRAGLQARLENSVAKQLVAAPTSSADQLDWRKLGNAALDAGNLNEAARCYQQGLDLAPDDPDAWVNLGFVKFEQGSYTQAKPLIEQALALDAKNADAWYILGGIHGRMQDCDWSQVEVCFKKALQLQPGRAEFVNSVGQLLLQLGRTHEAAVCYRRAEEIAPLDAGCLNNLGLAMHRLGDVYSAVTVFQKALALAPSNAQFLCNLGGSLQISGDLKAAAKSYRAALEVNPDYTDAHHNLLYALSFEESCQPPDYLIAAREFGGRMAAKAKPFSHQVGSVAPQDARPLRVGLVSGDLRNHAVGYFLENVVQHIRAEKMVLVAYSNSDVEDELTLRLKPFFSEWNSVAGLKDDALAAQIYSDKIDILIDLAGHTAGNRLPVFAWRPAPVQVAWLGYWASTGLAEIDYVLVDEVSLPRSAESMFSEKLWYLPDTRFCFTPPAADELPECAPLPAYKNGHVTFGSFQVLSKMSNASLLAWSKVLAGVPKSRLRLQNWQLAYPTARENLLKRLDQLGVDRDRVSLHGGSTRKEYLAAYSAVDVILDTHPFPGGTTTLEALWMGVPTLTQTGATLIERQGASILCCAGLDNWVASDEKEYVALALAHATDLASLSELRTTLRARVSLSPLFNAASFANAFEKALLGMWFAKEKQVPLGRAA
jgi:protein O-GlcNAc transferase